MNDDFGGSWTLAKLSILQKYLEAFGYATKRARPTAYLDLFAGSLHNQIPATGHEYEGSTGVALRCEPAFQQLIFWELEKQASVLLSQLSEAFPSDHRYQVVARDCNESITEGLKLLKISRRAPIFAFIDPKGLDVAWSTLEALATWRDDPVGKRKVEMWILLPDPAISRVLGLGGSRGRRVEARLNRMFGCPDWKTIYSSKDAGRLTPAAAKAEYVNLYRWRIEHVLGYRWTHALQLDNDFGSPMYTMIFATDEDVGSKIMKDVYGVACVRDIPDLRSRSLDARETRSKLISGVQRMFEVDPAAVKSKRYAHVPTWPPQPMLQQDMEFIDDPDADAALDEELGF
jgi:three-Cys-motif partner protein